MTHVGELILLAAPSCCGKSYFLEQLYEGRLQHLVQRMALDEPIHSYVSVIPKELQDYRGSYVPRMILHFAIPTIALVDGSLTSLEDEPRLDVVKSAERVTVITLLASADVLASRLRSRQRSNRRMIFRNIAKYRSERRKMARLAQIYAVPEDVVVAYEAWFQYVDSLANAKTSWIVTAQRDYEAFESNEWELLRSIHFARST